jgi:hypothetical protein
VAVGGAGVPVPDEGGAGSAAGVVPPGEADADGEDGDADGEDGDADGEDDADADGEEAGAVAPDAPCGVVLPQAASVHSKAAMPAGANNLVYLRVREPPNRRCGFNRQPSRCSLRRLRRLGCFRG